MFQLRASLLSTALLVHASPCPKSCSAWQGSISVGLTTLAHCPSLTDQLPSFPCVRVGLYLPMCQFLCSWKRGPKPSPNPSSVLSHVDLPCFHM